MGSWFSNIHVRKSNNATPSAICDFINNHMTSKNFSPTQSEGDADACFAIVNNPDCQWISIYSDSLCFDSANNISEYGTPMSLAFQSDVLSIGCFDSDYMFLNLIDATNNLDLWASSGRASIFNIKRRSNLSPWKTKVDDFDKFKSLFRSRSPFAEDVLYEIDSCLHLPQEQCMGSYEMLSCFDFKEFTTYLYFKLPDNLKSQELPKLVQKSRSLMPCFLETPACVNALNIGGESKGLSVYFVGPYVENDEITFSDVSFVKFVRYFPTNTPIELQKVQLPDGQWAYYYHDPNYRIPPKVDDNLSPIKKFNVECEREICLRFIPHGNPRKVLDITVVLVPDKNLAGQTGWNVWRLDYSSKKEFIQKYNESHSSDPHFHPNCLREEDYD